MVRAEFSVHDQPDFARVYDEDDPVTIRRGDLRALLDLATQSMDFSSGFWDEEQTEVARNVAALLGIDPTLVTPSNMACKYSGAHEWQDVPPFSSLSRNDVKRRCWLCGELDPPRSRSESE